MNVYDAFMRPFEENGLTAMRRTLMGQAKGHVLELGVGTGANLRFYVPKAIETLCLTDVDLTKDTEKDLGAMLQSYHPEWGSYFQTCFKSTDAMRIDAPDASMDTVVATLIFCTVKDVTQGLREIQRVLKPGGQLVFIEHVISKGKILAPVMHAVTPLWKRVASGCHLDRDFEKVLKEAGFSVEPRQTFLGEIFVGGIATA
jgi:ubiquinone/menaquinone biosynthesis C-methylase UbiE